MKLQTDARRRATEEMEPFQSVDWRTDLAAELAAAIADEYEVQCRVLCYGQFPSWSEVQARFEQLRQLL